jgi:hypothetical protein
MATVVSTNKPGALSTFEVRGEKFVILRKVYLDELFKLMNSFVHGEKLLKAKKTRSFREFIDAAGKRR